MRGEKLLDSQAAFIRALEKAGALNRVVEYLPSDDEIAERRAAKRGLTAAGARGASRLLEDDARSTSCCCGTLVDDEYVARALRGLLPAAAAGALPGVHARATR